MSQNLHIIQKITQGDQDAFRELYDLFSEKVYNTALSYTQNEADAEEVTQDVFVAIFKNAAKFKGNSTVNTWVYRITVNTALNFLQRKKRHSFLQFTEIKTSPPDFEHPGVLLENKERAKALFATIDRLPDRQKTAFILSFIEELPRKEVAEIMELSLKAVESLLQRAKQNLSKKLKNQYPNRRKR